MAKFRTLIRLLFSRNYLANLQIRKLASLIIGSDSHHHFFLKHYKFYKAKNGHTHQCVFCFIKEAHSLKSEHSLINYKMR